MLEAKPGKICSFSDFGQFIILVGKIVVALLSAAFRSLLPKRKKSLQDEIVLITGAGRGLGKELALKFAEQDATVVLWDIDEKSILSLKSEIEENGHSAHAYLCDVTDESEVLQVGKKVREEVGDVTILVNNAGVLQNLPFSELDSKKIKKTFEVNILAHFWTIRCFLPRMLELNKGHIVAISSAGGLLGWLFMADYSASKFAVVGLMEVLEEEIRVQGKGSKIKFTTVCPFTMDTGMNQNPTTRLPWIVPILDVTKSAAEIVSAVQREERLISVPRRLLYPVLFQKLLPRKVPQLIFDFLQYNIVPHKPETENCIITECK